MRQPENARADNRDVGVMGGTCRCHGHPCGGPSRTIAYYNTRGPVLSIRLFIHCRHARPLSMLAEQRHQYILSELSKNGALSVAELVRALDVSRETIRRDLNALAQRGLTET